jgi:inhibitor of cysteine peptidase
MEEHLAPDGRWLTEADAGRTVALHVGDRLAIRLPGNPTAGYSWEVAGVNARILAQVGEPGFQPSSGAIGSGGLFAFEFRAASAGQTALRLVYRRPWEKRRRPAQSFALTVVVKPPAGAEHGLS